MNDNIKRPAKVRIYKTRSEAEKTLAKNGFVFNGTTFVSSEENAQIHAVYDTRPTEESSKKYAQAIKRGVAVHVAAMQLDMQKAIIGYMISYWPAMAKK